jgi:hypothetical protein
MTKSYTKGGIVPDKQDNNGNWLVSFNLTTETSYIQYYTEGGKIWSLMKTRCSDSSRYSIEKPTYKDCENHFLDFQIFLGWCFTQEAYLLTDDAGRWQLDKDVLIKGNKVYSPETCAFIPSYINGIFGNCVKKTELPLGVNYRERFKKFVSQANIDGKRKHLGHFDDPNDAHRAWQLSKIGAIKSALDRYSKSFGSREDICQSLMERIYSLKEDILIGRETTTL